MQKPDKTNHLQDTLKALDSAVDEWNSLTNKGQAKQDLTTDAPSQNAKNLLDELSRQLEEFSEARNSIKEESNRPISTPKDESPSAPKTVHKP